MSKYWTRCKVCGEAVYGIDKTGDYLLPYCAIHGKEIDEFWKERRKIKYDHICDISPSEFFNRHKNVLELVTKGWNCQIIGTLLMGDYYLDGFGSRSCSGRMADILDCGDYLEFYVGSSNYLNIRKGWIIDNQIKVILERYEEADKKDDLYKVR